MKRTSGNNINLSDRRRGAALMIVLVTLGIASAIGMTLIRLSLLHRHQATREAFASQSRWLAESAFDRAAMLVKADGKSTGATWDVPAKELDGRHSAKVTIEIQPVENAPQRRQVTVTADFPVEPNQRTRTKAVRLIDL